MRLCKSGEGNQKVDTPYPSCGMNS